MTYSETLVERVAFCTRAPLSEFPDEWVREFRNLVQFHRDNPPAGWALAKVTVDHVSLKRQTYEPQFEYARVP